MTKTKEAETAAPIETTPDPELLRAQEVIKELTSQTAQYTRLLRAVMTQRDKAINEVADLSVRIIELEDQLEQARPIQ